MPDPSLLSLPSFEHHDLLAVIETPRGSRNKYAFKRKYGCFCVTKVLPVGSAFPFDFGLVPSTGGEDGDPLDMLVLMDDPTFPGCLVHCRLIGVIQARQRDGPKRKKSVRNDRLIAVASESAMHARCVRSRTSTTM